MSKKKESEKKSTTSGEKEPVTSGGDGSTTVSAAKKKPDAISRARYVGSSPVPVTCWGKKIMLWPNQVYKNLERVDEVEWLLKKRLLQKTK